MKPTSQNQLIFFENKIRQQVSHSISKTEMALITWQAAKKKPSAWENKIALLKQSHELFSQWLVKSLKGKMDTDSVYGRLLEFGAICEKLEQTRRG